MMGNLLQGLPNAQAAECFEDLLKAPGCRVERIVSHGQISPPGFWYEQAWDEWVLLLAGRAELQLASQPQPIALGVGDHLLIPAGERHRVSYTDPDTPTVWLALHLGEPSEASPSEATIEAKA